MGQVKQINKTTSVEIQSISRGEQNLYSPLVKDKSPINIIYGHLQEGSWRLLKRYYKDQGDYDQFIANFTKPIPDSLKSRPEEEMYNPSPYKPYFATSYEANIITLVNSVDSSRATIDFVFTQSKEQYDGFYITSAVVNFYNNPLSKGNKLNGSATPRSSTTSGNWNYVLLPDYNTSYPEYYDQYQTYFTKPKTRIDGNERSIPFKQIDFQKLKIKFKWCKKIGPIKVCGKNEYNYDLGKVISGKDVPGNETEFLTLFFVNPIDLTCFCSPFEANYTQFKGTILTAVIPDSRTGKLTFLREGLEPIRYGSVPGEITFNRPIAVKYIGGFLYVLDNESYDEKPEVKVLKINHTADGNFSITFIGSIPTVNGANIVGPDDIGGYAGTSVNTLLLADENGLHAFDLDKATGLPIAAPCRTYRNTINPATNVKYPHLIDILRIDASNQSGTTLLISQIGEVISFPNSETSSSNKTNSVTFDNFTYLPPPFAPSNLAYMNSEEKWYVTDFSSKIHTFTKEGRYIGGGGKGGSGEDNGELIFPYGITPNCISDTTSDYRYRYIVANIWDYNTGFKLFAPDYKITRIKTFENLLNNNLVFTFVTSGKWQYIEKGRGIRMEDVKVNGSILDRSLWNTQIIPNTDQLTNFPNAFNVNPASISGLRQGWNEVEIIVRVILEGEPNDLIVSKKNNFYWLPSTFTPTVLNNGFFKLNQYPDLKDVGKFDYIYKRITIGDKGAFYSNNDNISITTEGELIFNAGSTFYNTNQVNSPLGNIGMGGKITIKNGAYMCINNTGVSFDNANLPNLILETGYKFGVNSPELPEYANAQCKSPCEFFYNSSPAPDFNVSVSPIMGNYDVAIDSLTLMYADRVKWKVEKIVGTTLINPDSAIIEGKGQKLNLRTALGYGFQSCSQYKITLSIGCNGNGFIKSISKTIDTTPIVVAGKEYNGSVSEVICSGLATKQFDGFSPPGGVWSGPTGVQLTPGGLLTVSSIAVNTPVDFTYSYRDQNGCVVVQNKSVYVSNLPKPVLTITSPVCVGENFNISTDYVPGVIYNLIVPWGDTVHLSTPSTTNYVMGADQQGIYKMFLSKRNCNGPISDAVSLVIKAKPAIEAGTPKFACISDPAFTITGQTPVGGTWKGRGVTAAGVLTPSAAGYGKKELIYTITGTNGCKNYDTLLVTVGPLPVAGNDTTVCVTSPQFVLKGFTPTGGIWSGSGIVNSSGIFSPAVAGTGTKSLIYAYTHPVRGCVNKDTIQIIVTAAPAAPTASNNSPKCFNEDIQLSATTVVNATYEWTGPNGYSSKLKNPVIRFLDGHASGVYKVVSIINGNRSLPSSTTVTINPSPAVLGDIDQTVCAGNPAITLSGTPTGGTWSGQGVTGNTYTPPANLTENIKLDILTYTYTNALGCTNSAKKRITVYPLPTVNVITNKPLEQCLFDLNGLQLIADRRGIGPFTYRWFKNNTLIAGATDQTYVPTTGGNYCVEVTNSCGKVTGCYLLGPIPTTKLRAADCNIALSSTSQLLTCDPVAGAIQYEYKVTDPAKGIIIGKIIKAAATPGFAMSEIPGIKYFTNYQVNVRALMGDNVSCSAFGTACTVTTSNIPTTKLIDANCNITTTNSSQSIKAGYVPEATYYEYRVKQQGSTSEIGRVQKPFDNRDFYIYNMPGVQIGKVYEVDIRVFISTNDEWGTFGPKCLVTIECISPNLIITNTPAVDYPATVDISKYTYTDQNNIPGTVTYWQDQQATVPLINYTAITEGGTYYIKKTALNSKCFDIKPIVVTINPSQYSIKAVAPHYNNVHAIKSDGSLWGWGRNANGELGGGIFEDWLSPHLIRTEYNWKEIKAGQVTTLYIKNNGSLWMSDQDSMIYVPRLVGSESWIKIANGLDHFLAIKSDGTLWAWGNEYKGELGNGTGGKSSFPIKIGNDNTWIDVKAGVFYSLGLKSDGTVWGWGNNEFGSIGNGTFTDTDVPVLVGNNFKTIGCTFYTSYGITNSGDLYGWGENSAGSIGDGTVVHKNTPSKVRGNIKWKGISAEGQGTSIHAIAVDGTFWAWGNNFWGQLGFGDKTIRSEPAILPINNVKSAVTAWKNTYIIKNNGQICSVGDNIDFQLGVGSTISGSDTFICLDPLNSNLRIANANKAELEKKQKQLFNYPNPARTETIITYLLEKKPNIDAKIKILDFKGETMEEILISDISGEVKLDLKSFIPGLYFYSLESDGKKLASRKLLVY